MAWSLGRCRSRFAEMSAAALLPAPGDRHRGPHVIDGRSNRDPSRGNGFWRSGEVWIDAANPPQHPPDHRKALTQHHLATPRWLVSGQRCQSLCGGDYHTDGFPGPYLGPGKPDPGIICTGEEFGSATLASAASARDPGAWPTRLPLRSRHSAHGHLYFRIGRPMPAQNSPGVVAKRILLTTDDDGRDVTWVRRRLSEMHAS
jgi:hypothetical protein